MFVFQMSVEQPLTTRKRSQKAAKNGATANQKKKKLTGIALVDHILAQNALIDQQVPCPPAHSPQTDAVEQQQDASPVQLRRSKRLADRADTGAEKEPTNPPKKRKTAPKVSRKRKAVEKAIPEPICEESAFETPVAESPPKNRRKSFTEDVVQYFWSLSPLRPAREKSPLETPKTSLGK